MDARNNSSLGGGDDTGHSVRAGEVVVGWSVQSIDDVTVSLVRRGTPLDLRLSRKEDTSGVSSAHKPTETADNHDVTGIVEVEVKRGSELSNKTDSKWSRYSLMHFWRFDSSAIAPMPWRPNYDPRSCAVNLSSRHAGNVPQRIYEKRSLETITTRLRAVMSGFSESGSECNRLRSHPSGRPVRMSTGLPVLIT